MSKARAIIANTSNLTFARNFLHLLALFGYSYGIDNGTDPGTRQG